MKKILATLLALISMMTASAFAEDKLSIVCTTFPQYDWVRQILGAHADDVELTLLLITALTCTTTSRPQRISPRFRPATCSFTSAANPTAG